MGFIKDFFTKRPKVEEQPVTPPRPRPSVAPKNKKGIQYDPGLVDNLKNDHSHLVKLYGQIWEQGFQANNPKKLSALILQFKRDFQAHLLKENVKFYVYLEQNLSNDSTSMELVRDFRTEMNDIAQAVVKFCKKYSKPLPMAQLNVHFPDDYQQVGEVLTHRVSLEENELYTLYQP
ncbi:hemerythrin domain-containing protein [Kangiella shandongensis]|uniref:hemerythrin domain-containing protein n=1 Tax=Kangiella shandongensis TaxID=2763258 RepID=UPI001CBABF1F|nr:hemerythrin domain-containing protein [Kangiella shandongensis]